MRFLQYLKERSPLPAISLLSLGTVLSGIAINKSIDYVLIVFAMVVNNLIFIQLRLADEIKDFEKDKIINPTRPLPRGLFTLSEVKNLLYTHVGILIISSIFVGFYWNTTAAFTLFIAIIFGWLMYKEFYCSHELDKSPMLYALTHQVITFPIFAWPGLAASELLINNTAFIGWLLANFGASFSFEICRKLDPSAHELAKTYAHHYGRTKTCIFTFIFIMISIIGGYIAESLTIILPCLIFLSLGLLVWRKKPTSYKWPAAMSGLSSLIILWYPAISWLIQFWGK